MQKPVDPNIADTAPSDPVLTVYDEEHLITYLHLLYAGSCRSVGRHLCESVHEFHQCILATKRPPIRGNLGPTFLRRSGNTATGTIL